MGGMKVVFDAWNSTNLVVFEHNGFHFDHSSLDEWNSIV